METETELPKKPKFKVVEPNDPFDKIVPNSIAKAIKNARPNVDDLFAKAREMNVDPFEILLQIADGNKMALDLQTDNSDDRPISPELRAMACRKVLKYMLPTMKSTELTGKDGTPLNPMAVHIIFEEEEDIIEDVPAPAND